MEQSIKDGANPVVVACVGDSITEGIGATRADQYSYPAQLQRLLGLPAKPYDPTLMILPSCLNMKRHCLDW